jgi:hypothetical protein
MMAVLRYALLKSMRDGSLVAFTLGPVIMIGSALLGVALFTEGAHALPLTISPQWSAARTAAEIAPVNMFVGALFACLAGFWGFRGEVVSKSMGTFLLAVRPLTIQTAATIFGAAAGFAGYIANSIALLALTAALPPHPVRMAIETAILCLCAAAGGSLAVTISSEAWAIIPVYLCGVLAVPWLIKAHGILPILIALVLTMTFIATSTFLLKRRCAT